MATPAAGPAPRRRARFVSEPGSGPPSPALSAADVCVITVTYGDRSAFCTRVVDAVLALGVGRAIVVDNGSVPSSREALAALHARAGARMVLVSLPTNSGSAGGFAAGLRIAGDTADQPLLWLLDDDNVPDESALEELLAWYGRLNAPGAPGPLALVSHRPQRSNFRRMVAGVPVKRVTGSRSSFLHFNLVDLPIRLWDRLRPRRTDGPSAASGEPIPLSEGPYGGLLIHRSALAVVGLPDARLFTYSDDSEFTHRFIRAGGSIYLIPSSVVREVDEPWYDAAPGRTMLSRLLLAPSEFRVYFSTRNCVYFESRYWTGSRLLYRVNRFVVLSGLALTARILGAPARMALIRRAVADGENGLLGGPPGGRVR